MTRAPNGLSRCLFPGLILLAVTAGPAWADSSLLNSAITGASPNEEITRDEPDLPPGGNPPALATEPRSGSRGLDKESWPISDQAVSAVRIITGRPLNGADCREVIFEAKPMLRQRFEVIPGKPLVIPLHDLCLFALRKDSEDRRILLRVGESFDAIAITADPRLFSGLELGPYQQVSVPTRPLVGKRLTVSLEILWAEDLKSADGKIQSADLVFDSQ
jgi:hypothetical protein